MMEASNGRFNFPSGVQLPFLLRKKVEEARAKADQEAAALRTATGSGGEQPEATKFMTAMAKGGVTNAGVPLTEDILKRAFSSEELEKKLWKSSVALVEVQKQIHRGEEAYYEETFSHGNIFKGWEGYLDAKDASASSSSNAGPAGSRRVPQDFRWFSGSSNVSRAGRPPSNTTQWSSTSTTAPRLLSNKTSISAPSAPVSLVPSVTATPAPTPFGSSTIPAATTSLAATTDNPSIDSAVSQPAVYQAPPAIPNLTNSTAAAPKPAVVPNNPSAPNPQVMPTAQDPGDNTFLEQKIPKKDKPIPASGEAPDASAVAQATTNDKEDSDSDQIPMDLEPSSTKQKGARKRKVGE